MLCGWLFDRVHLRKSSWKVRWGNDAHVHAVRRTASLVCYAEQIKEIGLHYSGSLLVSVKHVRATSSDRADYGGAPWMAVPSRTSTQELGEMMRMFMLCNVRLAFPRVCYAGQIKEIGLHCPGSWSSHQPTLMQHVNKLHDHHLTIRSNNVHTQYKVRVTSNYEPFTASLCETMCV